MELQKIFNIISTALMAFLIASFTIFDNIAGGRYVYLALTIIIFLLKLKGTVRIKAEPYYIFNILMIVYAAFSSLWAWDPSLTIENTKQLLETFLCFLLLYIAFSNDEDTTLLAYSFKWSGYIVMLYILSHYGITRIYHMMIDAERMSSETSNPNLVAMGISYAIIFEFFEIAKKKKLTVSSPLIIPALIVIAATQSRKGFMIVVISCVVTFAFYHFDIQHVFRSIFIVAVFIGILILLYELLKNVELFSGIFQRMTYLINYVLGKNDIGFSAQVRQNMIDLGLQQFKSTPIFGIGLRNALILTMNSGGFIAYSLHNNYIELLCCGGIIGFIIYYSRYVYLVYILIRNRYKKADAFKQCFILMIVYLIIDYATVIYYVKQNQIIFLFLFLQIRFLLKEKEQQNALQDRCKYIKNGF